MGRPIARTLKNAGFEVLGCDLSAANRDALAAELDVLADAAELCRRCPVVLLSLPSSREVEQVTRNTFLPHAAPDSLLIDLSTADPASSRALHADLQSAGHAMLDAPVSGGPAGAAAGSLLIMVGGETEALTRARPVLDALAGKVVHCGAAGAGNVVKLIGNLLCASQLALVGEALALGDANEIDPALLLEAALRVGVEAAVEPAVERLVGARHTWVHGGRRLSTPEEIRPAMTRLQTEFRTHWLPFLLRAEIVEPA